jgi:DNA mismatch endonuclease (patch repair protein)
MKTPNFIDLFCGCGGFSLGMERAGFKCLAAIDFNAEATTVFQKNFSHVPHALQKDLTAFPPAELAKLLGTEGLDVIVGGPPCQGFSTVRQVDGANNGERFVEDERRLLYREFLKYVEFFQAKVFVMENVLGIRSASGGEYFTRVQKEARPDFFVWMPDVFTKAKRSEVMSRIRSRGNKGTELALAKLFRAHRITGWRRNQSMFGKPDFIFKQARLALFVDGCFWHGCPKHATKPKNNRTFWQRKLSANKKRDVLVTRTLRRAGWHVIRIWECALRKSPLNCLRRIQRALKD